MLTHPTHDRLLALGLTGMAKALEEQRRQRNVEGSPSRSGWACSSIAKQLSARASGLYCVSSTPICDRAPLSRIWTRRPCAYPQVTISLLTSCANHALEASVATRGWG